MGLGEPDLLDDVDGAGSALGSCSICLEAVTDDGDRSIAKLQCGHRFHLDCIGSAFNAKGAMQCPNCRKIEKGQWLYGSSGRSLHEFSIDESTQDEDLYDLAEMSFGLHWCPFGGMAHLPSSFDEGEFAATSFHSLVGQNAVYAEHAIAQSTTPYITYLEAVHPSSSSSSGSLDGSSYRTNWGPSVHSDIPSYAYPSMDVHQHRWDHHSSFPTSSISRADSSITQRAAGLSYDTPRSGSFMSPYLVGPSSGARGGSSITSSMVPPHPGSVARSRHRVQALQAYFQQPSGNSRPPLTSSSSSRRSSSSSRMPQVPTMSEQNNNDGFYYFPPPPSSAGHNFQEPDNHSRTRRLNSSSSSQVERDSNWGPQIQQQYEWMTYQSQQRR